MVSRPAVGTWLAAACSIFLGGALAHAQAGSMSIAHTSPAVSSLPEPGKEVIVTASIKNSGSEAPNVMAYVVTDGALSEVAPERIYPGDNKDFVADFRLLAPLGEISYQFVAKTESGNIAPSKRFALRRQCLPRIKLDRKYPDDEANYALSLGQKAEELERLIAIYDQANKMVEAIKTAWPMREDELVQQAEEKHEEAK